MEWLAILIPIAAIVFLRVLFENKVVWWEYLLPLLPVFIIVPCVKLAAEKTQTTDFERHGGWVVEARYYEDWDEWITEICSRSVSCGKDCTTTEYYDCSYRKYHPAYWELTDSNGYIVPITEDQFERLAHRYSNRVFVDMNRGYYTKDGDQYVTQWRGSPETFTPVATWHVYENRVQATVGVFAYDKVDKPKEKGLFEFPALSNPLDDRAVLGNCKNLLEADRLLQAANGRLGRSKQVRMWLLVFNDKPISSGFDQEAYWKGGNKNEVVVCVGLRKTDTVDWCHVFCWSPDGNTSNDDMKITIRDGIKRQSPFNAVAAVSLIESQVVEKFQRKHFKEFSYLTVATPQWAVWLVYVLTLAATVGVSIVVVVNECKP